MKFKFLIAAVTFSLVFSGCKDAKKPKETNPKQAEVILKNVILPFIEVAVPSFKLRTRV